MVEDTVRIMCRDQAWGVIMATYTQLKVHLTSEMNFLFF